MWHWLRKKVYVSDFTVRVSIGLACAIHMCFFLSYALVYWFLQNMVVHINHRLPSTNTLIIIDPYAASKTVHKQATPQLKSKAQKNNAVVVAPKLQHTQTNNNAVKKEKQQLQQKKIEHKKTSVKEVETSKKMQKKPSKKPIIKKKKEASPEIKKPDIKKPAVQKKAVQEPVKSLPEKVKEALLNNPAPGAALIQETKQHEHAALVEAPILIARSAQEAAALTMQVQLQEELLRVWHPPIGVETGVCCQVRITLDDAGKVQAVDMVQSSGTILFDVSARAAVQQAVWPKGMWGTTIELILQ
jgi:outer membrane biosynthesis protein TonB